MDRRRPAMEYFKIEKVKVPVYQSAGLVLFESALLLGCLHFLVGCGSRPASERDRCAGPPAGSTSQDCSKRPSSSAVLAPPLLWPSTTSARLIGRFASIDYHKGFSCLGPRKRAQAVSWRIVPQQKGVEPWSCDKRVDCGNRRQREFAATS